MKIPNKITPAWLEKNGYEIGTVYRDGYRTALVKQRGRKWVHLMQLFPQKNFKLSPSQAEKEFAPLQRARGKWQHG
jgi:hypothetical protein